MHVAFLWDGCLFIFQKLSNTFFLPVSSAPASAGEATLKQKCLLTTEL